MSRHFFTGSRVLLALALLLFAASAWAQGWNGDLAGGYAWEEVHGNEDSYRTQWQDGQGFFLEDFSLSYAREGAGRETFSLTGSGFGGAEPYRYAALVFRPSKDWNFDLSYDRRAYFYGLAGGETPPGRESWHITRWKGGVSWDGWSFAALSLSMRYYHKGGEQYRQLYGMNQLYSQRVDLDESMREASLRIETKTLPFDLGFEQTQTDYKKENGWSPGSLKNITGNDPDMLATLGNTRDEKQTVPTSRLYGSYSGHGVEVAGALLYSYSKLESEGAAWRAYDLGNGSIGRVEFIDNLMGSARQDTFSGTIRAAFEVGGGWFIKGSADYRDLDFDSKRLFLKSRD